MCSLEEWETSQRDSIMHVLRFSLYLQPVLPSSCNSLQRVQQMVTTTINCNAIPDQSICIVFVLYLKICKNMLFLLLEWLLMSFPVGQHGDGGLQSGLDPECHLRPRSAPIQNLSKKLTG